MWTRRQLLRAGGAASLLPFLPMFRGRARAQGAPGRPKRLVIVHMPQGTVLPQWLPTGGPRDFELPYISAPLEDVRDRCLILSGIDNRMPSLNEVGNAHINANYTLFTGRPFLEQVPDRITPGGPSVDQVLADRIGAGAPFPRLDFAIGGPETGTGLITPHEGSFFWYGPRDPVALFNDPLKALLRIFGDADVSPADAWALRARRASVLDGVLANFEALQRRLPAEDRIRLQAHAAKLAELEQRIAGGVGECRAPVLAPSPGYRPGIDDHLSAPLFTDLITTALACDLTRVATLTFANSHAPEFAWLQARNGGRPIVDLGVWENWHAVVHADYQPGMEHPYRWYNEVFAELLLRMAATRDVDGESLLDTSLVVGISEYSSGRHWNTALPIVLAGNLPGVEMGRWIDYMQGGVARWNGYQFSGITTNQLWTTVLQAFGGEDAHFGAEHPDLPMGPLPGLA